MGKQTKKTSLQEMLGEIKYIILSEDQKVVSISLTGSCKIYRKTLLPEGLKVVETKEENLDLQYENLQQFYHWCAGRLPDASGVVEEAAGDESLTNGDTERKRAVKAVLARCLSTEDTYWVRRGFEKVHYSDVKPAVID
ncbi:MAG: hypothetical protein IJ079_10805 [Lachnospiraceae bacterium]|nr:hypothetical protein [Lachnospiraceae bacterium]MBR1568311.1 hypothetical protein [Lachnospiraceae bacterium]